MQAVILAGGLGTRLRPMTYDIPKPMIPINNKPYLEYQLEYLARHNIREILILIGYLGNQIEEYFGNGHKWGLNIKYSLEEAPLGTGGGLKKAENLLEQEFLLIYGDSFLAVDYNHLIEVYKNLKIKHMICVYDNSENTDVISNIALDDNKRVTCYKKNSIDASFKYVDSGVLLLNKQVLINKTTK